MPLISIFGFTSLRSFLYRRLAKPKNKINLGLETSGLIKSSEIKKRKILIIGNASVKSNLGYLVDEFDGDVARINRGFLGNFNIHIGTKTTHWFVSRSIKEKGNIFSSYFTDNFNEIIKIFPSIKSALIVTYLTSQKEYNSLKKETSLIENLDILDTIESTSMYKRFAKQYKDKGGLIVDKENSFYELHGAPKPTTGISSILYSLLYYDEVFIHNFDFGRSDHYWGRENIADLVVGVHNFILDELIVDTLVRNGLVKWLA